MRYDISKNLTVSEAFSESGEVVMVEIESYHSLEPEAAILVEELDEFCKVICEIRDRLKENKNDT